MAVELLEHRLESVNEDEFEQLKRALSIEHINPQEHWESMPYLKFGLVRKIAEYLSARSNSSPEFSRGLYSGQLNKEPLKRVWYGARSLGEVPRQFLDALTDWEKIYFLAGRWDIRNPNLNVPVEVLTIEHLKDGLNCLYRNHYVRRAKGEYERDIELPEDGDVREAHKRIMQAYPESVVRKYEQKRQDAELQKSEAQPVQSLLFDLHQIGSLR